MHLQRAVALDSSGKTAVTGLVYLDCIAGKPKDAGLGAALRKRFASTRFNREDTILLLNLSPMLVEGKLCMDADEVKALVGAGLGNPSADGATRATLYGVAMDYAAVVVRSIPLAFEYAQAAVASDPGSMAPRINLIQLYVRSGKVDQAKQEYARLLAVPVHVRDKPGMDDLKNLIEANENHAPTR